MKKIILFFCLMGCFTTVSLAQTTNKAEKAEATTTEIKKEAKAETKTEEEMEAEIKAKAKRGRFSIATELGTSVFFGHSNLSPYGVQYRGEYKNKFSANLKIAYKYSRNAQAGIMFNYFTADGNYNVGGSPVADNLDIYYLAPQVGYRTEFAPKWHLEAMAGIGYMHYKSKSLMDGVEYKATKGFLGSNCDLGISRHLGNGFYLGFNVSLMSGDTSSLNVKSTGKSQKVKLDNWSKIKMLRADFMISIKDIF